MAATAAIPMMPIAAARKDSHRPFPDDFRLEDVGPGTTPTAQPPPLLPASYRTPDDNIILPANDIVGFLDMELAVERLNRVHGHFWMVGRPMPARGLHRQKIMGRDIVVSEAAGMHLVWSGARIFIKPLPRYLLDAKFWKENLSCIVHCSCGENDDSDRPCQERTLRGYAAGLLKSYLGLICHESDFAIAKEAGLLPAEVTWLKWTQITRHLLQRDALREANQRYVYGELRLGRLNWLYRLHPFLRGRSLIRGYYYGYNEYGAFFRHNLHWLFTIFAYVTVSLTAMQLGLATKWFKDTDWFNDLSSVVAVGAMSLPVLVLIWALLVFAILLVDNVLATRTFQRFRAKLTGNTVEA